MEAKEINLLQKKLDKNIADLEKKTELIKVYNERIAKHNLEIVELKKEIEILELKIQKDNINKLYKYCSKNNLTADDVIELIGGEKLENIEKEEKIIQGN